MAHQHKIGYLVPL